MKLFFVSLLLAIKHSSRRLLCLICVLGGCALLLWGTAAALPQTSAPVVRLAICSHDNSPLIPMAVQAVTGEDGLSAMLEVELVDKPPLAGDGYTAVITLPEGFVESIMNGKNLAPMVELDISSPLEAVLVRQLADVAADTLTEAQLGVYAAQVALDYGSGIESQQYQLLLAQINLVFVRAFAERLDLLETDILTATGALSLPQYYLAALVSLLFFAYSFLFLPEAENLRHFGEAQPSNRRVWLFAASFGHILLLELPLSLLLWLLLGRGELSLAGFGSSVVLALLVGCFSAFVTSLLRRSAACCAGCLLFCLGMGFCSGALLPLPLMPPVFERLALWLPSYYGQRLLGSMLGEAVGLPVVAAALLLSLLMLGISALCWFMPRREVA